MNLILIAVAATTGVLLSSILGWLDSKEKFNARKFSKSLIIAGLAGGTFAIRYSFSDSISPKDFLDAALWSAGADAIVNRAGLGRLGKKKKP